MAGKREGEDGRRDITPPVMPAEVEVDPIEPPAVEYVAPNVESVDVEVTTVDLVAPVFSPDDDRPEPANESESESESKRGKGRSSK